MRICLRIWPWIYANESQSKVNAARSQRTAAKLANEKIHLIYNSHTRPWVFVLKVSSRIV